MNNISYTNKRGNKLYITRGYNEIRIEKMTQTKTFSWTKPKP